MGEGGKLLPKSTGGNKYWILFTDNVIRFRYIYFIKRKSDASLILRHFLVYVKWQFKKDVEIIHRDGGGEFEGDWDDIVRAEGIVSEISGVYVYQQNSIVEILNKLVIRKARTMILAAKLLSHL